MKKFMAYVAHYVNNVVIAYGIFLPFYYTLQILLAIKNAMLDSDGELAGAISEQRRINCKNLRKIDLM